MVRLYFEYTFFLSLEKVYKRTFTSIIRRLDYIKFIVYYVAYGTRS